MAFRIPRIALLLGMIVAVSAHVPEAVSAQEIGAVGASPEASIAAAYAPSGSMSAYLGDCAAVPEANGSGDLCSTYAFTRDSDGMSAYIVAAVPELSGTWFFLEPTDGGWRVASTEHALCLDQPSSPPFP